MGSRLSLSVSGDEMIPPSPSGIRGGLTRILDLPHFPALTRLSHHSTVSRQATWEQLQGDLLPSLSWWGQQTSARNLSLAPPNSKQVLPLLTTGRGVLGLYSHLAIVTWPFTFPHHGLAHHHSITRRSTQM